MNIFLCNCTGCLFSYLNELLYNNLCFAQKSHKIVRFVQNRTKIPFVRTTEFCTKLVRILCGEE